MPGSKRRFGTHLVSAFSKSFPIHAAAIRIREQCLDFNLLDRNTVRMETLF